MKNSSKRKKKEDKDIRGMPRHLKAKKDVASCEKLRVEASTQGSGDLRMGQPIPTCREIPQGRRTWGTETSKYP